MTNRTRIQDRNSGSAPMKGVVGLHAWIWVLVLLWLWNQAQGQTLRNRQDGLEDVVSSSTAGDGNLHLTLFGRSFLWDNQAAKKIPPLLPHAELNYGLTDYLDLTGGLQAMTYVLQPGFLYARAKITTPDNKSIRFLGLAQSIEVRKALLTYFPSDGFRVKTEGFGPEGFLLGNGDAITSCKLVSAADIELIRISSWLPFKLYANLGWQGEFSSWINEDNAARDKASKYKLKIPEQDFSTVPMALGVELKTYTTDFFAELEAEPFTRQVMAEIRSGFGGSDHGAWTRFDVVGKKFDVQLLEIPVYLNAGSKLKYKNGLELQGGMSWLLSQDRGPTLGPCNAVTNKCRDGATDGYSPFYPQWKVFWLVRYPLWFTQPSSELYRSFLLRRYQDRRKVVDLDKTLEAPAKAEELDAAQRRQRLEERRKEADGKAVDLN